MADPDLQRAADAYRQGDLAGAAALFLRVLERDPAQVDALQLLGLTVFRMGHHDRALDLLDRALALDRRHVGALTHRALVLRSLGQPDRAEADLRRALRLQPELGPALRQLAALLLEQQRPAEAEPLLRRLTDERPDDVALLADLALALLLLRRLDEAEATATRAIALPGAPASAWRTRGAARQRAGRPGAAVADLEEATGRDPTDRWAWLELGDALSLTARSAEAPAAWQRAGDEPAARHALGRWLAQEGRPEEALVHLRAAVEGNPADPVHWLALADLLFHLPEPPADLGPLLARALEHQDLDHQRLERAVRRVLDRDPVWQAALAGRPDWSALAAHPLVGAWLRRTTVAAPDQEAALARLAAAALTDPVVPAAMREAWAIQGWRSEYAWWPEDLDRPLPAEAADQEAAARRLALDIPVLALSDDPTSVAVRDQYEQHPYPRFFGLHRRPPRRLAEVLGQRFPWLEDLPAGTVDVLVAGCGTGQHALTVASDLDPARVLAVDLSRASLGWAALRAQRSGLTNVELAQADILALGALRRRFQLVEAVGVLHHLADPVAGWQVLAGLTSPGGFMRVGLYSERGRSEVVAGRRLVAEAGWDPDEAGLRAARAAIRALPEGHPARPLLHSPDFTSPSGLRDLVFHACEHRFRPRDLAGLLARLGLVLVGFQHANPAVAALYREAWPDDARQADAERWDALEAVHPRIFSGMMVFWCRRPRG